MTERAAIATVPASHGWTNQSDVRRLLAAWTQWTIGHPRTRDARP
jgi:hypothetical protein